MKYCVLNSHSNSFSCAIIIAVFLISGVPVALMSMLLAMTAKWHLHLLLLKECCEALLKELLKEILLMHQLLGNLSHYLLGNRYRWPGLLWQSGRHAAGSLEGQPGSRCQRHLRPGGKTPVGEGSKSCSHPMTPPFLIPTDVDESWEKFT